MLTQSKEEPPIRLVLLFLRGNRSSFKIAPRQFCEIIRLRIFSLPRNRNLYKAKKNQPLRLVLLFSIQSKGLAWNRRAKCGAWNPSHCDGMAYSLLAHRLHGGTSCYVPSLTERSRSNLHSLADKQACRLASLDYHASACISFGLIPYAAKLQFHTAYGGFHTADKLRITSTAET